MFDRFDRLRHHAVVSSNNQHHDVRRLRSARTHHRKRFVTGRIEKHDAACFPRIVRTRNLHAVGADVLRDSTSFASRHVGGADGIEQRSLAVIDVAHDSDHRSARQFHVVSVGGDQFFKLFFGDHLFKRHEGDVVTKALAEVGCHIVFRG